MYSLRVRIYLHLSPTRSINSIRWGDNEAIDGSKRFSRHLLDRVLYNDEEKRERKKKRGRDKRYFLVREQTCFAGMEGGDEGNLSRVYFALSSTIHRFLLIIEAIRWNRMQPKRRCKGLFHLVSRTCDRSATFTWFTIQNGVENIALLSSASLAPRNHRIDDQWSRNGNRKGKESKKEFERNSNVSRTYKFMRRNSGNLNQTDPFRIIRSIEGGKANKDANNICAHTWFSPCLFRYRNV